MSTSKFPEAEPETSSRIVRNYVFILIGLFAFPLLLIAHFIAKKRRGEQSLFERSHYAFQYKTTSFALMGLLTVTLIGIAMLIWLPSETPLQHTQQKMRIILFSNASWLIIVWCVSRCIRGIYLCGASKLIRNPTSLAIWVK